MDPKLGASGDNQTSCKSTLGIWRYMFPYASAMVGALPTSVTGHWSFADWRFFVIFEGKFHVSCFLRAYSRRQGDVLCMPCDSLLYNSRGWRSRRRRQNPWIRHHKKLQLMVRRIHCDLDPPVPRQGRVGGCLNQMTIISILAGPTPGFSLL